MDRENISMTVSNNAPLASKINIYSVENRKNKSIR